MVARRPPLVAYREDLARRGSGDAFGPSDATWLSVATILSHAVDVAVDSRAPLLPGLREVVIRDPVLRDTVVVRDYDPAAQFELDAITPIVLAVVENMEDAGALNLAYSTLAILDDADLPLSVLERGRVIAQLGRVAWKRGALETSREQYRRLEVLGRVSRNAELRVRAWVGYSIVARLRGNYPEVRKWATRAVDEADRAGLTALGSLAYHSLMVSAAVAGDLNRSLVYGWRAYQSVVDDRGLEAEALLNLSEVLLRSGHPWTAAGGFKAALVRGPGARIALPALGGLARAAAALSDADGVHAAAARVDRLIASAGTPYESASTLLEVAEAFGTVDDQGAAAACRERALDIAKRHAYHEIVHRLEALAIAPKKSLAETPHALDAEASKVARAVALLGLVGTGTAADSNDA